MAIKVAVANGNWSTAGTWGSVSNTPTIHATTNLTTSGATDYYSAVFTAPSTSDSFVGAYLFSVSVASYTLTVALQEYNGASWADAGTPLSIVAPTGGVASTWNYFKYATPYQFTTITAGRYRLRFRASAAYVIAMDSGGSNFAYVAVDNRAGAPAATDTVMIGGNMDAVTVNTVTMDGTQTCGDGTGTTGIPSRTTRAGIMPDKLAISLFPNGVLVWDTAASATLTAAGNIVCFGSVTAARVGGYIQIGSSGTPYPSGKVATLSFNEGTTGNYGLLHTEYTASPQILKLYGAPLTYYKTHLASGVGSTGSPLVTADAVDWTVNDEIWIGSTDAYNECEKKYIKTKNSSTSYVLSDTAGGAESALAYTHTTDAIILNPTRNVVIKSTDATKAWGLRVGSNVQNNITLSWARFETYGAAWGETGGIRMYLGLANYAQIDYCAFLPINTGSNTYLNVEASTRKETWTGNIFWGYNSGVGTVGVAGQFNLTTVQNKTFTDHYFFANGNAGIHIASGVNLTFNNCYCIGNTLNGAGYGGIIITSAIYPSFNNCEVHASRNVGVWFYTGTTLGASFDTCLFGSKGQNTEGDFKPYAAGTVIIARFLNCTCASDTLIVSPSNLGASSQFDIWSSFFEGQSGKSRTYLQTALIDRVRTLRKNGASILDLKTTTAEITLYQQSVLANDGVAITVMGNLGVDANYIASGYTLPYITISGLGITPQTFTMSSPAAGVFQPFSFTATQTSGSDGNLTLTWTVQSDTATGHAYLDGLVIVPFTTSTRFYGYNIDPTNIKRVVNAYNNVSEATALAYTGVDIYG